MKEWDNDILLPKQAGVNTLENLSLSRLPTTGKKAGFEQGPLHFQSRLK